MLVAKISAELAQELTGKEMVENWYFNPVQDGNDNWIISELESESLSEEILTKFGHYEIIEFVQKEE